LAILLTKGKGLMIAVPTGIAAGPFVRFTRAPSGI
jgi:hypothetical protein